MRVNTTSAEAIKLEDDALEEGETFAYLESVTDNTGRTEADVKAIIGKVRVAVLQLKNIRCSRDKRSNLNKNLQL